MSTEPCVFIVDDDPAVRDALAVLLSSMNLHSRGFESADAFLAAYDKDQPGCLITDVCLAGIDGMALQRILKERNSTLPIIVISGHGDIPMSVHMVREGALDFLEKPFRNHVMLRLVREALEIDAEWRARHHAHAAIRERYAELTTREKEIAAMLAEGEPNKVIAARLKISPRTVEAHRANVLRKMEVTSAVALARTLMSLPDMT
ncbi:MAG: response regulator [Gammaproteobacteria bacterium]|nr:response regulator [Gammaproteobacteria bacterium]